ncbi:MAG: bifunctional oligoribonuclease/PAP phosphatase NrnA [Phycisphaerales bacterium]|nr:bifunctional oligoribonuclease/PAP phosphatase NrnA [Phycisphaerales bacterium]
MNAAYSHIAPWLKRFERPLLLSHQRPDGDALGTLAGCAAVLSELGLSAQCALFDDFPRRYEIIRGAAAWKSWGADGAALRADCDCVVVVDTCSYAQLEPAAEFLRGGPPTMVLDHHATSDDLGVRPQDFRLIDATAGAASLIVEEWTAAAGLLSARAAVALYVGLATDTGWFRFSNADARVFASAARLCAAGVRPAELYEALYQQDPEARLRLTARMLGGMRVLAGGRLVVLEVRQSDLKVCGADAGMTEDLVNEASRMAGVEATVLFNESEDGVIRVNLRSRRWVDVAAIARQFGGGGHVRAAGARQRGEWGDVTRRVIEAVEAALAKGSPAEAPAPE